MAISPEQLMQAINKGKAIHNASIQRDTQLGRRVGEKETMYENVDYNSTAAMIEDALYPSGNKNASKLPPEIQESFAQNPSFDVPNPLDQYMPQQKRQITEQAPAYQYQPQRQQPVAPMGGGIDYSIVKAIFNECLNEFSKKQLNESASISTIGLKEGKIKIVDTKGNVYAAKLEYKGNTKDAK